MFFQELLKYTSKDEIDYKQLQEAINLTDSIAKSINTRKMENEKYNAQFKTKKTGWFTKN